MIRVVLAQPRGFCAGVERAIEIVERALKKYGPPIYVRHEIVHNRHVVEDLRTRAYHSADATPLSAQELAGIAPEKLGDVVFALHPSTAILRWPNVSAPVTARFITRRWMQSGRICVRRCWRTSARSAV